jgi:hypothetical protein
MVGLDSHLPVCPVERAHLDGRQIDAIEAADVEGPSARIDSWADERVDSAMTAKIVLRRIRVELVKHEIGFTREDTKIRIGRPVPESAPAMAQRAVAVDDVVEFGSYLERDSTTVA